MQSHTARNGSKTLKSTRHSALVVDGKDPNFDYSFRLRADIDQGNGMDMYGYEPVGNGNTSGEVWGGPAALAHKSKSKKQIVNLDTILCRRPKSISAYFKEMENEKYNAQVQFVRDAAKNARLALRELDPVAVVKDDTEVSERAFTQRTGPTDSPMPDRLLNHKDSQES